MNAPVKIEQKQMTDFIVSETFKAQLRPLNVFEADELEKLLCSEGRAIDPLIVWKEENILVDGHHRFAFCQKHNLPFNVTHISFASYDDALAFAKRKQEGRRNLTDLEIKCKRGELYVKESNENRGGQVGNKNAAKNDGTKNVPSNLAKRTSEQLAEKFHVHANTIKNDAKLYQAVETLKQHLPKEIVETKVLGADGIKPNIVIKTAQAITKTPEDARPALIDKITADIQANTFRKDTVAHVSNNSGVDEWYTPAEFIEAARAVMGGIDLDPATSDIANRTVKAERIYTAEINGLIQDWTGRIWMNPPYSQPLISHFADKLADEMNEGNISDFVVLVNNATETKWFQIMASVSSAICFPKSRIRFIAPDGTKGNSPLQGQAILYGGNNGEKFSKEFSAFGAVLWNAGK